MPTMSDEIFDISTVDGRQRYLSSSDLGRLMSDADRLRGDRDRLAGLNAATSTSSASSPPGTSPPGGSSAATRPDDVSRLQRDLDRAVVDLASARRTLATYRRGVRALVASTAVTVLMAVAGIATAIVSSLVGVDASTAVMWLLVFGWSMALGSVAGLVAWVRMHRIKYEWVKRRSGYSETTYEIDSKDYLDPQRIVDMAELSYAATLRKLTEYKGHE